MSCRLYLPRICILFLLIPVCYGDRFPVCYCQDLLLQLEEQAVIQAVKSVAPSVVRIETIGGLDVVNDSQVNQGPTTGVIVSDDGYIISSAINFLQDPASIIVRLEDNRKAAAEIVARDHSRQLVLLKCNVTEPLSAISLAQRESLRVGQTVIAVGKIFDKEKPNVSVGILSAKNRIWDRAVQTDAKISPANFGGPLIDLNGRVIGILVPLSPNDNHVTAGIEWYDSGIGFAVPLDDVLSRFEALKSGKDIHHGLIGIAFKGSDIYADEAVIGVAVDGGPAAKAGIKPDDVVVKVNGIPVQRQSDFKHALGRLYAGDTVDVVVDRDGDRQTFEIELVETIPPYEKPSIGVVAGSEIDKGVSVRFVVPDSPADIGGIRGDDIIVEVNGTTISDRNSLAQSMMRLTIGEQVEIKFLRSDANESLTTVGIRTIAQTCEPLDGMNQPTAADNSNTIDLLVPEFKNKCFAIVPRDPNESPAVFIWVPEPGPIDKDKFVKTWSTHCLEHNIAMLVPQSADDAKWEPGESEFIEKAISLLRNQIEFDPRRVAIGGIKSGGAMAALSCFNSREAYSGLIVLDSTIPSRLQNLKTSATNPLSVFIASSTQFDAQVELQAGISRLTNAKFPVHVEVAGPRAAKNWAKPCLGWVDSLDRF